MIIVLWITALYRCRLYTSRFGVLSRGKIEAGFLLLEPSMVREFIRIKIVS